MIALRPLADADLPIFFEQERDPLARRMAAFTSADGDDRAAFDAHWVRVRADPRNVNRTIVDGDRVLGHIAKYEDAGPDGPRAELTYWIDRAHWGRGVASAALALFLQELPVRPLYARAASDNAGSLRVLQRCGFVPIGVDRGFAAARGEEIEETVLRLSAA